MDAGEGRATLSLALVVIGIALVCSLVAAAGVLLDAPTWVRTPAALGLFALAPGAAILGPRSYELGLVIALSLAISVIGAQIALWAGSAPGEVAAVLLVAACVPLLSFQGYRVLR